MDEGTLMDLGKQTLMVALVLVTPALLVGMTVGILVSLFQTVTSLQEQTLSLVPKMLAVVATILLLMPWILGTPGATLRRRCCSACPTTVRPEAEPQMADLTHLPTGMLAAFVLHVLRAGAFLLAMPIFGSRADSRMLPVRVGDRCRWDVLCHPAQPGRSRPRNGDRARRHGVP